MARQHHYRRRISRQQSSDLDMTTFLNLMVVLVPFLLITAVFSRITIVELNLPSSRGDAAAEEPTIRIEVIVRELGLEISNGTSVIASIPKVEGEYDLATLSEMVMTLKRQNPDSNDASVLLEPDIEYDYLIQVMDVVRSAALPNEDETALEEHQLTRVALFTNISIGDAP